MEYAKYKQKLEVSLDKDGNPTLALEDWEHRDYIEDVLCEHYDIEYDYLVEDDESGGNTLFFGSKVSTVVLRGVIEKIN